MPKRWNLDHEAKVLDWNEGIVVQPGASHDFTDEQIAAGLAGLWGDEDPRAGLKAERAFKKRRDQDVGRWEDDGGSAAAQTTEPADEPDESKE